MNKKKDIFGKPVATNREIVNGMRELGTPEPPSTIGDELEERIKNAKSLKKEFKTMYSRWEQMRFRCNSPKATGWHNYGGRGIKVCDRWQNSFVDFLRDMGEPPSPELTIDRIDNDGDYEPSNCRWATRSVQNHNQRKRRIETYSKTGVQYVFESNKVKGRFDVRAPYRHDQQGTYIGSYSSLEDGERALQAVYEAVKYCEQQTKQARIDTAKMIHSWRTKGKVYQVPYARQVIRADAIDAYITDLEAQERRKAA